MVIPYPAALGALVNVLGEQQGRRAADALRQAAEAREVPVLAREGLEGLIWKAVTSGGTKLKRVPDVLQTNAEALLGPAHGLRIPGFTVCRRRVFTGLVRRDVAF
eukprot:gene6987-12817_t